MLCQYAGFQRSVVQVVLKQQGLGVVSGKGRGHNDATRSPDIAETEARLLLALDFLRETSYRWLMRALAAGGNPAQAA